MARCNTHLPILTLLGWETMEAEKIAVLGEEDMLFMLVAKDFAELLEALSTANALSKSLLVGLGSWCADGEVERESLTRGDSEVEGNR